MTAGRYTIDELCELAAAVDAGFDRPMFADMLRYIDRFDDEEFTQYGIAVAEVPALRARVEQWRANLNADQI